MVWRLKMSVTEWWNESRIIIRNYMRLAVGVGALVTVRFTDARARVQFFTEYLCHCLVASLLAVTILEGAGVDTIVDWKYQGRQNAVAIRDTVCCQSFTWLPCKPYVWRRRIDMSDDHLAISWASSSCFIWMMVSLSSAFSQYFSVCSWTVISPILTAMPRYRLS